MDYKEIVYALRCAKSRNYRGLFSAAADTIEALIEDLKSAQRCELCNFCAHNQEEMPCSKSDYLCDDCPHDCPCKYCRESNGYDSFKWRGVQEGGQSNE